MSSVSEALLAKSQARPYGAPMRVLVVGAGFAGSVVAQQLHAAGIPVQVVDKAEHIGGTAYDYVDDHGVQVHAYGPHAFHTKSRAIVEYLTAFTKWRHYEHRVVSRVDNVFVPMPISRATIAALWPKGAPQTDEEMREWLDAHRLRLPNVRTSEELVLSMAGPVLYELLYREYTVKQWGCDPRNLASSVCGRLPFRLDDDTRYFTDWFQAMPADGFTALFERLLDGIDVELKTEVTPEWVEEGGYDHVVWTGRPDEFFGYRFGRLPFRSMTFRMVSHQSKELLQPCATVNEPTLAVPHTRTTEYRWLTGQEHDWTTIQYEYASDEGPPHYPVPNDETAALMRRYRTLEQQLPFVSFVGRLARYQYMTMDQTVGQALSTARMLVPALQRMAA
jgi:UDP-galactopyranose mutase